MSFVSVLLWASLAYWLLVFIAATAEAPHRVAGGVRPIRASMAGVMVMLCVLALGEWWRAAS